MSDTQLEAEITETLRLATPDDVPVILQLIKSLAEYQRQGNHVSVTAEDLKRDGFGPHPQFQCILAEVNDKAVGLAIFHRTYSTWEGARGFYIDDLFVDESVRGIGMGHKLIREVARMAKEQDCTYLALNVVHANPARNFYDRFGFTHVDDLLTYRLMGSDKMDHLIES